jgi:dTDP-4-amino-4,6-dideoxygalactose transaminase
VKIITTAEGGMAVTNHAGLARRMELLRSHGITREAGEMTAPSQGGWYYQQLELGFNYRMTDVLAALGTSQMKKLDIWIASRSALAVRYGALLEALPVTIPRVIADATSAWHLYVVQVENREAVFWGMRQDRIGVNVHYIPVHLQPYYQRLGFKPGDFPAAEAYYAHALSLPMYTALSEAQQDRIVASLKKHSGP